MSVQTTVPMYKMVNATLEKDRVIFQPGDFEEAVYHAGFFRIKQPDDLDMRVGEEFTRTFPLNPRYVNVGEIDPVNGFLCSQINQTVRFTLERDHWNELGTDGEPLYPVAMQELGHKLHAIGITILRSILTQCGLPEELWFKATAGSTEGEGSHFLLCNHYDPKLSDKPYGVAPHEDFGWVTLVKPNAPGLQAEIDRRWCELDFDPDYLIVNFGRPLAKLLPGVRASLHRVIAQTEILRTSIVAFIDPRVGPFRKDVQTEEDQGYVYDWDRPDNTLVNGEPVTAYFKKLSDQLYGAKQS